MDKRLQEILTNKHENYLLPFYWQRGDHTDTIPQEMQMIYDSGCRAVCVESRPHPDFAGEGWWRDMDIILAEAKKRDMQVWLLDDDKFPTGHATGLISKKYPHLRQWNLMETHVDVAGPMKGGSVIFTKENPDRVFLGAYAYKRYPDKNETCHYDGICLDEFVDRENGFIDWDVPEGVWRIFCYYKARVGAHPMAGGYIDMINPESVRVLIEAVYEPHYAHYKEYFGNTFVGFFSDEPCFGNHLYKTSRCNKSVYNHTVGKDGLALPWNENVLRIMTEKLGYSPIPYLNLLWYEDDADGDRQCEIRYAYMDTVTALYSECFTKQLADWAHDHGVMYIGHIIEDMNTHLTGGAGHYFRALRWQDMSGIDIVLNQVMPGMSKYTHASSVGYGRGDGDFYHYVLGKLGASLAHLNPDMQGRAMCEVFGAFGYGEDSNLLKFLIDFLLVRGINHFVPHAFSSRYPDSDCPPHFGVKGRDPSFEAFTALMKYTNKVSHLLLGATHKANAALLYFMDSDWASRYGNAMVNEPVAERLYDAHIDYDIVPHDILQNASVEDGKLHIADEYFDCLIVPYADHIAKVELDTLKSLKKQGLPVYFINEMPENSDFDGEVVALDSLVPKMQSLGMTDVQVEDGCEALRIYHCVREGNDIFMFVNEDVAKAVNTTVTLPCSGDYARLDILNDKYTSGTVVDGKLSLNLAPNQSEIVVFGDKAGFEEEYEISESVAVSPNFTLYLADNTNMSHFEKMGEFEEFFNVTNAKHYPRFAGKMKYTFELDIDKDAKRVFLDLGEVGQNATLAVNGTDCGIRITKPYAFEITNAVREGKNSFEVVVSNTLVRDTPDFFSQFLLLAPSGLLGGIKLKYVK